MSTCSLHFALLPNVHEQSDDSAHLLVMNSVKKNNFIFKVFFLGFALKNTLKTQDI